jgi:stage IV sporulation protein B
MFKKIKLVLLLLLIALPNCVFAYSDYIIASGDNIGIKLKTNGVLIIGTYDVNGKDPALEAGLKIGDRVIKVNNRTVSSIDDITSYISSNRNSSIKIGYIRDSREYSTTLILENNKTGLYLKDTISGIGTLTFIDPTTKKFGALGHEITDSTSGKLVDAISGEIFESSIISITPSRGGTPGEKNASFNSSEIVGSIYENTNKGIFGTYDDTINTSKLYKVAKLDEVKTGEAKIKTVISGTEVKEYSINILRVTATNDKTINIVFEITDKDLMAKTGGIVQGMSGSPIIQNGYIIGAVTHVVVDDPSKGYGILITNMLEEAED